MSASTVPESDRHAVYRHLAGWDLDKVRAATVLVVGAGALGNEVLKNLALLGVGRILIMDVDRVEAGNLSRSVLFRDADAVARRYKTAAAADGLRALNPEVRVTTLNGDLLTDLGLGAIAMADVVIGCVDNRLARLYLNRYCHRMGKAWVSGGILGLGGQVQVYEPGRACYECELSPQAWADIRHRVGCPDIALRYQAAGLQPTTPLAASVIGAVQVQEAMRLLMGWPRLEEGTMWSYEGRTLMAGMYAMQDLRLRCDSHFRLRKPHRGTTLSADMALGEALAALQDQLGWQAPRIMLDHGVATAAYGLKSGTRYAYTGPLLHLRPDRLEAGGEALGVPREHLHHHLDATFPRQDLSLRQLGIPYQHILRVREGSEKAWVSLSRDDHWMAFSSDITAIPNPFFD